MSNFILRKGSFAPLFLCLLLSCTQGSYKENIINQTETILKELQGGNAQVLPGYNEFSRELNEEQRTQLNESFKGIEDWTINLGDVEDDLVTVYIELTINDTLTNLIFQFRNIDNSWVFQQELELKTQINSIQN